MYNTILRKFFLFPLLLLVYACSSKETGHTLFQKLDPDQTGITFENTITTNDRVNAQTDAFIYNGAGVAIGDINNNGLPDIFFSGNMVSSKLYLNLGDMQFEDITERAGLATSAWATGASMVDINNNGYLDIYVSVSGPEWSTPEERANLLFLNNGDGTFREAASEFNIHDTGFTTHAVFFDYNGSGYLDLFLLGNSPGEFRRGESGMVTFGERSNDPYGFDQLYRNNGDGTFTNVSEEAGILKRLGYGLGVVATDLNGNGWPDIYVSNDITPNDVLYINNGDGTFTDRAADFLRHTSFAGMGIDIADFTNNGWPDILQSDMMPEHLPGRKRMSGSTTYSGFMDLRRLGYFHHYNQNTLQMNHGVDDDGNIIFSEIARMAGVAYTDWNWTVLFGDYNNDGFKDVFATNGYPKAVNDFDYLSDMHNARRLGDPQRIREREREILRNIHSYNVPNYIFRNNGDLTFTNKTVEWGLNHPGYSYGAAHADLNNNGRLDLVVNNINATAFVYENVAPEGESSHYLQIKLNGDYPNLRGIGAKIFLWANGQKQYIYHSPYRGYMSTMDGRVHFGLGEAEWADSLKIIWPDGRQQLLKDIPSNQVISLHQSEAVHDIFEDPVSKRNKATYFHSIDPASIGLTFIHRDDHQSVDYSVQSMLHYMVSRQGPPIAVGDITGNGFDDLYIGASAGFPGKLYFQQDDGTFIEAPNQQPFEADRNHEDWGAVFFDANSNGLLDLYVASGSYHTSPVSSLLQDRLYINYGNGRFLRDNSALPQMLTSTSAIAVGDYTGNGLPDLFIGGRLTPRDYPKPSRSYILRNDGGRFTDITREAAPVFIEPGGMITSAVWVDLNGNGKNDLVTAGEWMPVQFFENTGNKLQNITSGTKLPPNNGWWYSIAAADFTGNGYPDILAGNLGLNHSYTTSPESRFGMVAADFSGNRETDIILTREIGENQYPFHGLAYYGREMEMIAATFTSFESFSTANLRRIFGSSGLNEALHFQSDTFASAIFKNLGDGTFSRHPLPNEAQVSPIKGMVIDDVTGDGNSDVIIAGNMYHSEPNIARADAGNGLLLKSNGDGLFQPVPVLQSGLLAPGDVRTLALINTPEGKVLLVGNNNGSLQYFRVQP
ncbi:MAG: hypothetical protein EA359_04920 [Balneolaceae bacterium]|nr:MAG: hypothetical protein EA359_04920 [Balneolaceae bacterium]